MELKGKIVFASGESTDFDIWTLDLSNNKLSQLTEGDNLNDMPRWSPDGKQIAYISTGSDYITSLCVMDSNGANKKRLTNNVHASYPSWSPDGRKILYTANAENNDQIHICLYDLASAKSEIIVRREGQETDPSFSRDGKKILFSSIDHKSDKPFSHRDTDIWEYEIDTKKEKRLVQHSAKDYCPVYSPDGSKIAFISHQNGRTQEEYLEKLYTVKSNLDLNDKNSVDNAIAALKQIDQDGDVYVMNSDGSNLKQLTFNNLAENGVRWSPCGKYLIYTSAKRDEHNAERIKIIDSETATTIKFIYDRELLMSELGINPKKYMNHRKFLKFIPDFLEKPFMMSYLGAVFWGEERWPDWTYSE